MTVKVIITDMDGTFLDDTKRYDSNRFMTQFRQLQERNIKFVIASGNQYYQLISYFPQIKNQISFVAENGALVFDHGKQIFHGELTHHELQIVINELIKNKDKDLNFVVCGLKSAYVNKNVPKTFISMMKKHYNRLKQICDYREIDDVLLKFSINLPNENIPDLIDKLYVSLDGIIQPIISGFGFVDLIIPGLHKANGINRLLRRWNISPKACVGIGDSENDIEMLKFVNYSFAMSNAVENIKIISRFRTNDNNHQGVLNVIQSVLDGTTPFDS